MKQEQSFFGGYDFAIEFRNVTKYCNNLMNEPDYSFHLLRLAIFYVPWSDKE